jgi:hypothetical protein
MVGSLGFDSFDSEATEFIGKAFESKNWITVPLPDHRWFLSHSTKDHHFIGQLKSSLEECGKRCFVSRDRPICGKEILPELRREIEMSDRVIVVVSPDSIVSDYVWREVEFAYAAHDAAQKPTILPVWLSRESELSAVMATLETASQRGRIWERLLRCGSVDFSRQSYSSGLRELLESSRAFLL